MRYVKVWTSYEWVDADTGDCADVTEADMIAAGSDPVEAAVPLGVAPTLAEAIARANDLEYSFGEVPLAD